MYNFKDDQDAATAFSYSVSGLEFETIKFRYVGTPKKDKEGRQLLESKTLEGEDTMQVVTESANKSISVGDWLVTTDNPKADDIYKAGKHKAHYDNFLKGRKAKK